MATINVSGNNMSTFDAGTEHTGQAYVGTTYEGNYVHKVTCRYKFTTDAYGATSVTFKTANATLGVGSNTDNIGRLYFDITDSSTKYKTYQGNDYGTKITSYSYGNYVQGTLSIKLLPNTTYYVWIWPASNFSSYTRLNLGTCTVTTSGTYGTASTISANNGTFGSSISVTLTNSVSGTTNTLTVSCGGITKTLLNNSSAMSATWTPSLSEYGAAITNAKSATATFTVTTKYGSVTWGTNTKTITVTFPSSAGPSISNVAIDYDNTASAALSAFTVFVQGYSKARATITAAGQYSATISTYALTINGVTVSSSSSTQTSASVTTSGTVTATIKVTDSRGFTATTTQDFTVQPYSNPSLTSVDLHRSDSGGTAAEDGEFLYAYGVGNISSLSGQNTLTMSVAFKTTTGSYGTETAMTSGTAVIVSGLNADVTYVARITLTDALGNSATAQATINSQKWAMKFNATATAVAFGKAPEADKVLEIPYDWQIVRKNQAATETSRALFSDDFVDLIYPVGSIYMSVNSTNPGTLFGGTWERITGRFLLAATDGGSSGASQAPGNTGGAATHTLSANELPKITGQIGAYAGNTGASAGGYGAFRSASGAFSTANIYQYARAQSASAEGWPSGNAYGTINMSFGDGTAHNNMPPYLAVYVWKRTA